MNDEYIKVEVAYAKPDYQCVFIVEVEPGTTIETAIKFSGILDRFPEIDLSKQPVGVFSKPRNLSDIVHAGERIEIYRPLALDPKVARRRRASRTGS